MKIYIDTGWMFFLLFISTLIIFVPLLLLAPLILSMGIGIASQTIRQLVLIGGECLMLWILYKLIKRPLTMIKERKHPVFQIDGNCFSYRQIGSLTYQSIPFTEIKSIRFYCMFKHDYFDLITQNAKELTFSLAHLNTDNKKLSLACQKLMGMEKAYGWDETDLRCKNNII
jgi:hypothetical protein